MKFCMALTLLASAGTVLSFPLVDNSGSVNGFKDAYMNITIINAPTQDFAKRQNQQTLALIMFAISGIADYYDQNSVPRDQFTQALISILWDAIQDYNYIICYVDHDYNFQGVQGVDWDHKQVDVDGGFDVVVGGAGTFVRHGDGGYINWAYVGDVASSIDVGSDTVVTFNAPTGSSSSSF